MLIVILVIIGLSVLILGHEAGHFFAAKLLGMKIEEFGLGLRFGWESRIYSKKINGIEYSVNWLPLGGFVRIAGENDPSLSDESKGQAAGKTEPLTAEEKKGLFHFRPAWQRALVLFSGVAANVVMGWLAGFLRRRSLRAFNKRHTEKFASGKSRSPHGRHH